MAETVVNFLIEKLGALIIEEEALLSGLTREVQLIKGELQAMKTFLRDADRKKDSDAGIRGWVRQVREAAYNVEDALDEFVCDIHTTRNKGVKGVSLKVYYFPSNHIYRHRMATRLQEINEDVRLISERRDRYGLEIIEEEYDYGEGWQRGVRTAVLAGKFDAVGMKKEYKSIVNWLSDTETSRKVISVTGMPGLGKTTLVSKAFMDPDINTKFDCCACVSVSQNLRTTELLQSIIKQLDSNIAGVDTMNAEDIRDLIVNHLRPERYLVILDDVWTMQHWLELTSIFPDCGNKSRLLVTTRNVDLARAMSGADRVCELQLLSGDEPWKLFQKKVFGNEACPTDLEDVARDMVGKCDGLPFAILSLGGLLLTQPRIRAVWADISSKLSSQMRSHVAFSSFYKILLLCYYQLPYYLKHCFLYCSMFPKDFLIKRKRLIRLWVAKGLVTETNEMTMEEVAEEHLKELIGRSLLQVAEVNPIGRVKAFRMHDMMRDVAWFFSLEEEFSISCNQVTGDLYKYRCMSIYDDGKIIQSADGKTSPRLHSVIVFNNKNTPFLDSLQKMTSSFRLLRVLDLKGAQLDSLPDELVELLNLRYLSLSETRIKQLPKSFRRLRNLQTLDLRETEVVRLPNGIGKLTNLRHLFCYKLLDSGYRSFHSWRYGNFPAQLCDVTSLQSLGIIEADQGEIAGKIGKLTELRRLDIAKVQETDGEKLCASIRKMKKLVRLKIVAISELETLNLGALYPPPPPGQPPQSPPLKKLELVGRLERVPQWLGTLSNLTNLGLSWSGLTAEEWEGLLSMLQQLSSLVVLSLQKAYDGQALSFERGFAQVKQLSLTDFAQSSQLEIKKDAMSSLRVLNLRRCGELKDIPLGIEHLAALQEIYLEEMPKELVDRLRADPRTVDKIKIISQL